MTVSAYVFDADSHSHLTPYLAALHAGCITHDGIMAHFLPPLKQEKLLSHWKRCIAETQTGARLIIILLDESEPLSKAKGTELVGVATMLMPESEVSPFRGLVEKFFISTKTRRRGYGKRLMAALETEAVGKGRTLLLCDAEVGTAGVPFYETLNFNKISAVPNYGYSPHDGSLRTQMFFYKDLRSGIPSHNPPLPHSYHHPLVTPTGSGIGSGAVIGGGHVSSTGGLGVGVGGTTISPDIVNNNVPIQDSPPVGVPPNFLADHLRRQNSNSDPTGEPIIRS